jgi:hypothetical protein
VRCSFNRLVHGDIGPKLRRHVRITFSVIFLKKWL